MISLFFLKNTKNKSANVLLNTLTFADIHSWLGYCDSNTGMSESESDALPLGDTPIYFNKILLHTDIVTCFARTISANLQHPYIITV